MNNKEKMIEYIKVYLNIDKNRIVETKCSVKNMTLSMLRDSLVGLGRILDENITESLYVIEMNAGFVGLNHAVIVVQLDNNTLTFIGGAREGLVNQHTAEKAIDRLVKKLQKKL